MLVNHRKRASILLLWEYHFCEVNFWDSLLLTDRQYKNKQIYLRTATSKPMLPIPSEFEIYFAERENQPNAE